MSRRLAILLASGLAAAAPAAAPEHQYGPAPSWADYRLLVEGELRNRLVDPDSAKITWLGGYYRGFTKSFLAGRWDGYVACGRVNARNRMGGYTGFEAFVAVVDYGRVLDLELARSATDQVTELCVKAWRMGLFPPLTPDQDGTAALRTAMATPAGGGQTAVSPSSASPPSPPADPVLTTASGLTLRAMPEGAYVAGVAAGSPAARAGVAPGMVVAAVNGVALAGMGAAAPKVVDAAGVTATLALVGGRTVLLGGGK